MKNKQYRNGTINSSNYLEYLTKVYFIYDEWTHLGEVRKKQIINGLIDAIFNMSKKDIKITIIDWNKESLGDIRYDLLSFIKGNFGSERIIKFLKKNPELMEYFI